SLRVATRVDTAGGRVGDPITLSVRVEGTGNVKLFPRPTVAVPWGTLVAAEERVRVDTSARRIRGSKEYDWILTPHRAGELEVPAVRYTFFNPDGRRYETAVAPPVRVSIAVATAAAAADTAATERALTIRTRYRGPVGPPLYSLPEYWLLLAAAPLPAVILGARRRTRPSPRVANRVHALRAAAAGRSPASARDLRRAFVAAVGDRLGVHPDAFSRSGALERVLRHAGVPAGLAADTERFLRRLDEAAYAAARALPDGAGRRALELYGRIDAEALRPWEVPGGARLMLVALLATGLAGALAAAVPESPRELFDSGVRAYEARRYGAAQRAFGTLARREPRAPDAWANFGTASWAARDTARAVAGWQRALRLEPLAGDVRARLREVREETLASAGFVPPITQTALAVALACCWWGAWVAGAIRIRRREGSRRPAVAFAMATVAVALGAVHQVERLNGRDLVVVQGPGPLAVSPALGADRTASAEVGEVARVRAVYGVWSHVVLDGGRHGWVESSRLISLAAPPLD
ncbi:MAG: BatD family protein, partial [Gemmatimonadaceae bacterium]